MKNLINTGLSRMIRFLSSMTGKELLYWLGRRFRFLIRTCWEAFCWLIIPIGYGTMLLHSLKTGHAATWVQLVTATLALSPFLLRLFARYLSEFSIGSAGFTGKISQSVINKAELVSSGHAMAFNDAPEEQAPANEFLKLTPPARKVLSTLWKYQVKLFSPQDIRRWGFVVGPKSPEFQPFNLGALELMQNQLALFGPNGFLFLTNAGIDFCNKWNDSVATQKELYSNFTGK